MTLEQLHNKLQQLNIPPNRYHLHGLYGSIGDEDKPSLSIRMGAHKAEYEVYFKERGQKHSASVFYSEEEACDHLFRLIAGPWIKERVAGIEGFGGMTVNERLYASALFDEFYNALEINKSLAKEILKWLLIDESSIKEIVK